jgi:hypothetical protein
MDRSPLAIYGDAARMACASMTPADIVANASTVVGPRVFHLHQSSPVTDAWVRRLPSLVHKYGQLAPTSSVQGEISSENQYIDIDLYRHQDHHLIISVDYYSDRISRCDEYQLIIMA